MDVNAARERAEEALKRADKASPGPWEISGNCDVYAGEYRIACCDEGDNEFIASARTDVPKLAQDLLEALEETERLTDCLKRANQQAEHYEREWYLRGDEIERLETLNMELSAKLAGHG